MNLWSVYTQRERERVQREHERELLSGFAIQIEHEPERGKPLTDF